MEPLPIALYGAHDLAEIDRRAQAQGLAGATLMQRAGEAAFRAIAARWPGARRWLVYAGGGNNGGDGYVVAHEALRAGFEVMVAVLKPPRESSTAAGKATAYAQASGRCIAWNEAVPANADVLVDALFGIGLDRALEGDAAAAVQAINAAGTPVAAIDLPSGLHADTGAALDTAVQAALTITFIGLKPGLFTGVGSHLSGRLVFARLGVPDTVEEGLQPIARRITESLLKTDLPHRERDAHKGRFGHVLVVGGETGTGGAVILAATAALRSGAGLVSVATRPAHVSALLAARPEIMAHGMDETASLSAIAPRANVVALGPGLGQTEWSRGLWQAALEREGVKVVDADALNLLAKQAMKRDDWILTPHPGEAARLLETDVSAIENDRPAAVRALVERYGGVAVLKGAGTLVASANEKTLWLCDRGNPGMASGGMGDALTGIIAGLLAQGLAPFDAARLGVWLHATAGDKASLDGERGLLASDLIAELRSLVNA
ncbi:MAG: NAD(P)H-hydrate dehydratase [Gammaproteobacteria bacterium]